MTKRLLGASALALVGAGSALAFVDTAMAGPQLGFANVTKQDLGFVDSAGIASIGNGFGTSNMASGVVNVNGSDQQQRGSLSDINLGASLTSIGNGFGSGGAGGTNLGAPAINAQSDVIDTANVAGLLLDDNHDLGATIGAG